MVAIALMEIPLCTDSMMLMRPISRVYLHRTLLAVDAMLRDARLKLELRAKYTCIISGAY